MNPDTVLGDFLRGSRQLDELAVRSLRELIDCYPSCQIARLLLLAAIKDDADAFATELHDSLDYFPDRRKTAELLAGLLKSGSEASAADRTLDILNSFLGTDAGTGLEALKFAAAPVDYFHNVTETAVETTDRTMELLDSFLDKDWTAEPTKEKIDTVEEEQLEPEALDELPDDSDNKPLDPCYFTETYAQILIKQKQYEQALEIIRSLYLNFPNKSAYFADQIRYLEILVRVCKDKNK